MGCLRNPLYCGKIFIPAFKDEESCFVRGQHEPLISEREFSDVQDILDGRKQNTTKPKIVSMDNLPLRGLLQCPKCERMLTGSDSKGKMENIITITIALALMELVLELKVQMKYLNSNYRI